MIDNFPERNELAYIEWSGQRARYLHKSELPDALRLLHNIHGHFSDQIITKRCVGKFSWPTRHKDIKYFCRTCPQCQMLGPLRPSQGLLPIVQLQPWDCFGTDYSRIQFLEDLQRIGVTRGIMERTRRTWELKIRIQDHCLLACFFFIEEPLHLVATVGIVAMESQSSRTGGVHSGSYGL